VESKNRCPSYFLFFRNPNFIHPSIHASIHPSTIHPSINPSIHHPFTIHPSIHPPSSILWPSFGVPLVVLGLLWGPFGVPWVPVGSLWVTCGIPLGRLLDFVENWMSFSEEKRQTTAPAHKMKPPGILPRLPPAPRIPRKRCQEPLLRPHLHTRRGPG